MLRINKYLAKSNLGSRRQVESLIKKGDIKINGIVCTDLSKQIEPSKDAVEYKGKKISFSDEKIYLMLNKPKKYLVAKRDDFDRKTVYDLIPDFGTHIFSIGRLDYMSEGLLLLTNNGDFAQQIIHPRYKLPKLYKVTVKGNLDANQIKQLREGVLIDDKKTVPALVYIKKRMQNKTILKMTIFEGRKRQIRYMLKKVDSEVLELKRLQIGDVKLGKLPVGMWRMLKPSEVMKLTKFSKFGKFKNIRGK